MANATVTVLASGQHWLAFDVNVEGSNVYLNYLNGQHTSYHSSGQHHQKTGKNYVLWTGGISGKWEPLRKLKQGPTKIHGREKVAGIGWVISKISTDLPAADKAGDFNIDIAPFLDSAILAFEISVVGSAASDRNEIVGFPVLQRHRMPGQVEVEIEAFLISDVLREKIPRFP